jgi:hypothetical protein
MERYQSLPERGRLRMRQTVTSLARLRMRQPVTSLANLRLELVTTRAKPTSCDSLENTRAVTERSAALPAATSSCPGEQKADNQDTVLQETPEIKQENKGKTC